MRKSVKLLVIAVFGVFGLALFLSSVGAAGVGLSVAGMAEPGKTPPRNAGTAANATANKALNANANVTKTAANTEPANVIVETGKPAAPAAATTGASKPQPTPGGGKMITKQFTLGQGSLSEYGEVAFNHDTHAFQLYSPDGKSVVGCAECHHTDQPKSALKLPLITSERDTVLTLDTWRASSQKVSECKACHFQDGNVPDGKTMPTATYTEKGKSVTKNLNNELAYHINCNTCHDEAYKLRPELKKRPGFATGKDCTVCHLAN